MTKRLAFAAALTLAGTAAIAAQPAPPAPAAAAKSVQAGRYTVDANHTQVVWSVDHFGFSRLYGMVGAMSGTLDIDPSNPRAAKVAIDIPLSGLTVTSPGFAKHLATADLFDTAKFPTARFVSRSVTVRGTQATIAGDLTLRGVTKPLTLDARLHGAGANPMNKKQTVGFSATARLKRSDFNLGYAVPAVSDEVNLEITAAFEK
ncbi:polyisoprenoid-binding protein YceI [Sphingomonas kaistensis]|uniref:Polyisoprenoid-binding protein YceI n=1 Tax=Sphingomonas kaistensis TaxID=298708 RepID=A0A7X6BEF9_9SPHN|nr:YceI family protein [Sphingomonas kaistensis]NJC04239.1 polyisoprenoid-binding protein YceI [Sphingomonas kaistensis]